MSWPYPSFTLNDGNKVPALAFGTGTALYQQPAAEAVKLAVDNGLVHIDTAQMYGNEDSVGDGLVEYLSSHPRESIYVTTKLATPPRGGTVRDALKTSLQKLKLDYVDLYLIHDPTKFTGKLAEVWKELEGLKEEGLAKSIGVSNFRLKDFDEFVEGAKIKPAVNQIEFHPYVYDKVAPIIELHKKFGITTASYGGLTPVTRVKDGPVTPVLAKIKEEISSSSGKTVSEGQVLTAWLLAKDAIVVTTTSKASRIKETLKVFGLPPLSSEQVDAIDKAGVKLHSRVFMRHMDL